MNVIYTHEALRKIADLTVGSKVKDDNDEVVGFVQDCKVQDGKVLAKVFPEDGDGTYAFVIRIV